MLTSAVTFIEFLAPKYLWARQAWGFFLGWTGSCTSSSPKKNSLAHRCFGRMFNILPSVQELFLRLVLLFANWEVNVKPGLGLVLLVTSLAMFVMNTVHQFRIHHWLGFVFMYWNWMYPLIVVLFMAGWRRCRPTYERV